MNCLNDKNIELYGDSFTDKSLYLEIKFQPCETECADNKDDFLKEKYLQIVTLNSHINMTDFSEIPIHYVVDTSLNLPLRRLSE